MDELPRFEGFEVLERLRSGPMTEVYRAVQVPLGRRVTIKTLGASILPASPFAAALEREASLLAQLSHPNVVALFDFVREDGRMWLVLEDTSGFTLAEALARAKRLPLAAALYVARSIASALEHAHEHGIIHRDLRPQHVLVSLSGELKLADFAVATDERLPTAPEILSASSGPPSLAYASPEQILGEPPDPRSDLFSLGSVLYELIAGTPPFGPVDDRSATARIRNEPPPPLARFAPEITPAVERLVLRCLQKLPADRFESAAEFGDSVDEALRELGELAPKQVLLGALADAGFPMLRPRPALPRTERERQAAPSVLRVGWVLAGAFVLLVAGGVVVELAARRTGEANRDGASRRLELVPQNAGYLKVVAQPWAHVIVDGQKLETTPFARPVPLTAGTHYVRLEHPLAPTERRTIEIRSGETIVLDVAMHVRGPRSDAPLAPLGSVEPKTPAPVDSSP